MQLTLFSDYSLRLLLYLAAHPERLVPVQEAAHAYGVSHHHMVKVVQLLVAQQCIDSVRGRGGGLRLKRAPAEINVGQLVRLTEPHMNIVECFDRVRNTCPIEPVCGLKGTLAEAQRAFLGVLDRTTLADFLPRRPQLLRFWKDVPPRPPRPLRRSERQAVRKGRRDTGA